MSVGLQRLREDADRLKLAAADKGEDPAVVDRAVELDERRRALVAEADTLKAERNEASRRIGEVIRGGADPNGQEVAELKAASAANAGRIDALDADLATVEAELDDAMLRIPNPADPDVPVGGEEANVVVRTWGEPLPHEDRKPHWELAEALGIIDNARGAKITGSGFPVYLGDGSTLQRALIGWFLDVLSREHGMTEVWPPVVVNADSARGTGQIPDKEDQMYVVERDGLYLIPTAEVPVTNLHRDEILDGEALPIRYAAYSASFRREAGAAGRDTRGILRVHQFDKVEMVSFTLPEHSSEELEWLTACAEGILQRLGLAYRVVLHEHRRDGLRPGPQVRPRGVGARRRALARGQQHQQLPRLPGATDGDPVSVRGRREARARPYPQWLGVWHAADGRRADRDVPAARRQHRHPRGAAARVRRARPDRLTLANASIRSEFLATLEPTEGWQSGRMRRS